MTVPPGVGFVGLGNIGGPMARRWLDWPAGLTVFDVAADAVAPFAAAGATVAGSPADLARRAGVISVMVRDDEQVTDVVCGPDGILTTAAPGTVVVVHSTVEAATPARLAERADAVGVQVIDAPVSGGAMGAADGTLALMVGGTDEAVEAASSALHRLGSLVAHVGPVGAGTRAKLARNLITFAGYAAAGEAMRLAEAAGVDLGLLGEVVRHSDRVAGGTGMVMLRPHAGPYREDDGLRPPFEHARGLGEKDLDLALALGEELGVDLPIATHARATLAESLGVPHPTPTDASGPASTSHAMSKPDQNGVRARGVEMMRQVYGWDIDTVEGPFVEATVDHLFGEVWAEGTLSVKEHRLLLIGAAVASGMKDVAQLQLDAAVRLGELDADDLRSIVVFLAHYTGWPHAARLNSHVEEIIARHRRDDGR